VKRIWYVETPDGDTLTVIAETAHDAIFCAAEFCDDIEGEQSDDAATEASDDAPFRWVGFESASDATEQVRDLEAAGVPLARIRTRTVSQPGVGDLLWEVGTRDEFWCRLPACVLCGGGD